MNELEPLIPYLKEISATLGKHVGKRLGDVLKHFGTDITKYPKRMIERKDAEATAKSEARIALIQAATQNVTENPELDPDFVKQVLSQSIGWTFEEVTNFNNILGDTTERLLNNPPEEDVNAEQPTENVSKDWLNEFRSIACKKSTEDAQELFSRVLAGEIRKPGSFSLKALTTLANIDKTVAIYFKAFCSLCLIYLDNPNEYYRTQSKSFFKIKDARIPIIKNPLYDGPAAGLRYKDDLSKAIKDSELIYTMFGFRIEAFTLLIEHNLILDNTKFTQDNFWYNGEFWQLTSPDAYMSPSSEGRKSVTLCGYALTHVGKELYHLVDFKTPPTYWERISKFLKDYYDINLYKIPKP